MSAIQGFPTQQKTTTARPNFVTLNSVGKGKFGIDSIPKLFFRSALGIQTVVSYDFQSKSLEVTGHDAIIGDMLRFETGANAFVEVPITAILDVDHIEIAPEVLTSNPIAGDTLYIMKATSQRGSSDGTPIISQGPIQYNKDGVVEEVTEDDAVPANNRALPSKLFIEFNGEDLPVHYDGTPANTVAIPVALTNIASGQPINITAGDLNVNITHNGPNPSSVRIGDGTTEAGVTLANELKVNDADAIAELVDINTALASPLPLPTGASTLAEQILQTTELTAINTELDSQTALLTTIDADTGAIATSTASTVTELQALNLVDFATEAKQDTQITALNDINTELNSQTALLTTIDADTGSIDGKLANNYGVATGALRTASQIGNASGVADFGTGTAGAQTIRTVLADRSEAVATPLSTRLGDGTNFIDSTALANAQKTVASLTKMLTTLSVSMGWDGADHREISVDSTGKVNVNATVNAGSVTPSLVGYAVNSYTVPASKTTKAQIKLTHGQLKLGSTVIASKYTAQTDSGMNEYSERVDTLIYTPTTFLTSVGTITTPGWYDLRFISLIANPTASIIVSDDIRAVTDATNAATGILVFASSVGLAVGREVVIYDNDTNFANYFITANNTGTGAVTFSATQRGSAANLSAYSVAQSAKIAVPKYAKYTTAYTVNVDTLVYAGMLLYAGDTILIRSNSGTGTNSIFYTVPANSPVDFLELNLEVADTITTVSNSGMEKAEIWYEEYDL
jgi:hypothetical protein